MRRCEFLTPYRRWRLWQTPCPSSRVSCRPARTCVLSGMRYCIIFYFIFEECLFYLNTLMAEMMLQQRFIQASHFSLLFQVYCQVIKQTNHVPQPNSPANRAHWHLLTCMSCTFLPSRAILRYLRFHLKRCVQTFLLFCLKKNSNKCVIWTYPGCVSAFLVQILSATQASLVNPWRRPRLVSSSPLRRRSPPCCWDRRWAPLSTAMVEAPARSPLIHTPQLERYTHDRGQGIQRQILGEPFLTTLWFCAAWAGCGEAHQRFGHGGQQKPVFSLRAQLRHRQSTREQSDRRRRSCQVWTVLA